MATENQIRANRAYAAKSTGPIPPESKRVSSQNTRYSLIAGTVMFKNESIRRFNDLASALTLELKPRNSVEAALIQTMTVAHWHLLRMWGIQTAAFDLELARARQGADPAAQSCGAVVAAIAFRALADNSRSLALMHRFEFAYDRQYTRALALLLKLRQAPGFAVPIDPLLQLATETRNEEAQNEPNFDIKPGSDPTNNECNEQVPDVTPSAPRFVLNPISPSPHPQGATTPAFRMPDTSHGGDLRSASLAENAPPLETPSPPVGPRPSPEEASFCQSAGVY